MKLRVGQIGIGAWGKYHCKILSELPEVIFSGIYDIEPSTGITFSQTYNTNFYDSLEELVQTVDALIVTAPTSEHFYICKHALLNRVHVFVEKPICVSVEQANELSSLSEAKEVVLQVGHIERFNPAFQAIQFRGFSPYYLESYRMAPFSPRGTDVSVVLDLMVHDIDLILKIVNQPVKNIEASGITVASKNVDFANAQICFENGCIANLTASRVAADRIRQLSFYQENEQFVLDFLSRKTNKFHFDSDVQNGIPSVELTQNDGSEVNPLKQELLAFINAINQEQRPVVDAADGIDTLNVAIGIENKIGEGVLSINGLKALELAQTKKP